jgi:putative transcriptional regulator
MKHPKKGQILVSEPFLNDPNFRRSVVLLTGVDAEGAFGFILNHPLQAALGDFLPELADFAIPVYNGGPVSTDNLYFIHRCSELIHDGVELMEDVFLGGNIENLKAGLLKGTIAPENLLFFIGYSGWSPGQLEGELDEKSWILADLGPIDIFKNHSESLWREILLESGGESRIWAHAPEDPILN